MAGDWIKVEHTTPDKPEVVKLAGILGIDQDAVVGKLLRLWIWADQQSVSGNAITVTNSFLDRLVFCPGFAAGLVKVGWLNGREGLLSIPNFDRHNGQTAKNRANTNRRVANSRKAHNERVTKTCNENVTLRALQKPLPEKRREENKQENNAGGYNTVVFSEPPTDPASPIPNRERLNDVRGIRCADNHADLGSSPGAARFVAACLDINPSWGRTIPTAIETAAALEAYRSAQGRVTPRDMEMLRDYYASGLTHDRSNKAFWRPDSRRKFWECFGDVLTHADRWAKETRWKPAAARKKPKLEEPRQPEGPVVDTDTAAKELREWRKELGLGG